MSGTPFAAFLVGDVGERVREAVHHLGGVCCSTNIYLDTSGDGASNLQLVVLGPVRNQALVEIFDTCSRIAEHISAHPRKPLVVVNVRADVNGALENIFRKRGVCVTSEHEKVFAELGGAIAA